MSEAKSSMPKAAPKDASKIFDRVFGPYIKEEDYPAGNLIFKEGSRSDRFYIIKAGEVEIRKIIDRRAKSYKLVSVLAKGEFFGEMAIFQRWQSGQNARQGKPRTADAFAKTDVRLSSVSANDIARLFKGNTDPGFGVMGFLASVMMERLGDTTKELAAVYDTGRFMAQARSAGELAEFVMENVFKAVDSAEAGLFAVWNDFNAEFEVASERGFGLGRAFLPEDAGLSSWFLKNPEAFLSSDLKKDGRLSTGDSSIFSGRSLVAAPFISDEKLTGFIVLINRKKPMAFSFSQMVLLSAIAGYVSVALENLRRLQEELDRARFSRIKASVQM